MLSSHVNSEKQIRVYTSRELSVYMKLFHVNWSKFTVFGTTQFPL